MKYLLILPLVVLSTLASSQCDDLYNTNEINNHFTIANVRTAGHFTEQSFFLNETEKTYTSIFASNLWFGGQDPAGNLKFSGSTYNASSFQAGPMFGATGERFLNPCQYFDRLWVVSAGEIEVMKSLYASEGQLTSEMVPTDILEWPAKGNPFFDIGEENGSRLTQDLAPFWDQNLDGEYNALHGDLPLFRKDLNFESLSQVWSPYVFAFSVYNDGSQNGLNNTVPVDMEIHQSVYLFNCEDDTDLNNTVFTNFSLLYHGQTDINDFRIAYWEDADFGCFTNDLVGCNPELDVTYVYNDAPTEQLCSGGVEHFDFYYGMVKNSVFLSHELHSFMGYNNAGIGNPNPNTTDPNTGMQYYNLLDGTWLDGTPMTYGGNGFNPGSVDYTNYMFPDLPNDPSGWSGINTDLGFNDTRTVSSFVNDGQLVPGQILNFDIASQVIIDKDNGFLDVFDDWAMKVTKLKDMYHDMITNPQTFVSCDQGNVCLDDCVWPGDVWPDGRVDAKDFLYWGAYMGKEWEDGPERFAQGTYWSPYIGTDWENSLLETNGKHADCNGNGNLNALDLAAIDNNFGRQAPNTNELENEILTQDLDGFKITFDKSEVEIGSSLFSRIFNFSVRPGEEGNSFASGYHGVSFDVVFDSSLVAVAPLSDEVNDDFFSETAYANAIYKGEEMLQNFELSGDNRINVIITSESGENQFPTGYMVQNYSMIVKEFATTPNLDNRDTLTFEIQNAFLIDADGNRVEEGLGFYNGEIAISNLTYMEEPSSVVQLDNLVQLDVFPNPAQDVFTVRTNLHQAGKVKIVNLNGSVIYDRKSSNLSEMFFTDLNLQAGMYLLNVEDEKGNVLATQKLVMTR